MIIFLQNKKTKKEKLIFKDPVFYLEVLIDK
jgi:hypothetical protein